MKATSKEYAINFCRERGLDESLWGDINNVACDAYHEGQQDALIVKRAVRKIWLACGFSEFSWKYLLRQEPQMTGGDIEPLLKEGILVKNTKGTKFRLTEKANSYL